MTGFAESDVEEAALSWFEELDYNILHGPDLLRGCSPDGFTQQHRPLPNSHQYD
jgi:hypothetical protein